MPLRRTAVLLVPLALAACGPTLDEPAQPRLTAGPGVDLVFGVNRIAVFPAFSAARVDTGSVLVRGTFTAPCSPYGAVADATLAADTVVLRVEGRMPDACRAAVQAVAYDARLSAVPTGRLVLRVVHRGEAGGGERTVYEAPIAGADLTLAAACGRAADTVCLDLAGEFHATTNPGAGGRLQFELSLYDRTPEGGVGKRYRMGIARYGAGQPAVGRYPLAPLNAADPGGRFYATYQVGGATPTDTTRGFVSTSGELVITESTPERVAGTFRFTGREYYAAWPPANQRGSGTPARPTPDGPTVEVTGTFTSTAYDPSKHVVCVGTGGPSVMVEVRDQAGRPAAIGTTIVIQDGAFRDSVDGSRAVDSLRVGAGERRPGTYEVRLYKPGYKPVILRDVKAPGDPRCNYAEPTDIRKVTLELLPDAPAVRSIVVFPSAMGFGAPDIATRLWAVVDAAPGTSRAVRWASSDTTVATVTASSDSTAVLVPKRRTAVGEAVITATSVADGRVRGHATVTVWPPASARAERRPGG